MARAWIVFLCVVVNAACAQDYGPINQAFLDRDADALAAIIESWAEESRAIEPDPRREDYELVREAYAIVEAFAAVYMENIDSEYLKEFSYIIVPNQLEVAFRDTKIEIRNFYPQIEIEGKTVLYESPLGDKLEYFTFVPPMPDDAPDSVLEAEVLNRAKLIGRFLPQDVMMKSLRPKSFRTFYDISLFIYDDLEKAAILLDDDCVMYTVEANKVDGDWQVKWPWPR